MPKFLVVDDDPDQRVLLSGLLKGGIPEAKVVELESPAGIHEIARREKPHLILLDWMLGEREKEGAEVCRELKADPDTREIPVVILTGNRTALEDRFQSVEAGADLYIEKPYRPQALVGYVQALLRKVRARPPARGVLKVGELRLSRADRLAWIGERETPPLPEKQFLLLWMLAHHSPHPVSTEQLIRHVWNNEVRDQQVAVAVSRLRDRLGEISGAVLESVPGLGYRLRPTR